MRAASPASAETGVLRSVSDATDRNSTSRGHITQPVTALVQFVERSRRSARDCPPYKTEPFPCRAPRPVSGTQLLCLHCIDRPRLTRRPSDGTTDFQDSFSHYGVLVLHKSPPRARGGIQARRNSHVGRILQVDCSAVPHSPPHASWPTNMARPTPSRGKVRPR